jgi:hypothetical protein
MPKNHPKIEILELDTKAREELQQRVLASSLCREDANTVVTALESLNYLEAIIREKAFSIGRLNKLVFGSSTEKTDAVLGDSANSDSPGSSDESRSDDDRSDDDRSDANDADPSTDDGPSDETASPSPRGHGRNGVDAYTGAERIATPLESLQPGDPCPDCAKGKVYAMPPAVFLRFTGQAPVAAEIHECERVRCNLCGAIFTASPPEGIRKQREYDITVPVIVALLKYGSGLPFNRLEGLQGNFGIPLPASNQWHLVDDAAKPLQVILEELKRQAALGDIVYNDDTTAKILDWMGKRAAKNAFREETDEIVFNKDGSQRCGMYTTGIVSTSEDRQIALFFTGRRHAGENLDRLLGLRSDELARPIQMCDPLSQNMPDELKAIVANCLAHGRRQFVDVVEAFPDEVKHVLQALKKVYKNDATARKDKLSPEARLRFHQAESGPIMKELKQWMEGQIKDRLVESNSGLGKAISYMTTRWEKFTLFLREPGAPLDNNICERALKKAILHRKNSYFYKTLNGAHVGDLFMSLIYTCQLCQVNAFDYLTELLRHADKLAASPQSWMPWNYRQALAGATQSGTATA